MNSYNCAFLFNGIGTKPQRLREFLSPHDRSRYDTYINEIFQKYGLNPQISENTKTDCLIAGALTSAIADRVVFESYLEKGIIPDIGCGYSSGLTNICACFSSVSFDASYDIIFGNKNTVCAIEQSGNSLDMGIIIGMDAETVKDLIHDTNETNHVVLGSVNSNICVMISGYVEGVEHVLDAAVQEGALKAIKMNTGIACHSPFITPYVQEFTDIISKTVYSDPKYPIVSVFSQKLMITAEELHEEEKINLTTPMQWELAMAKMEELGVTDFFDTSADGAIKKFSRLKKRSSKIHTYKDV
ncbi:MAG: ACP S-malonyltransferase [Hominimerdicola sp.]